MYSYPGVPNFQAKRVAGFSICVTRKRLVVERKKNQNLDTKGKYVLHGGLMILKRPMFSRAFVIFYNHYPNKTVKTSAHCGVQVYVRL